MLYMLNNLQMVGIFEFGICHKIWPPFSLLFRVINLNFVVSSGKPHHLSTNLRDSYSTLLFFSTMYCTVLYFFLCLFYEDRKYKGTNEKIRIDWDGNSPVIEMIVLDPEPEDRPTTQLCDFGDENPDEPMAQDFQWQAQLL